MAEKPKLFLPRTKNIRYKVWNHFGFRNGKDGPPTKENLDMDKAVCMLCSRSYAFKGLFQALTVGDIRTELVSSSLVLQSVFLLTSFTGEPD